MRKPLEDDIHRHQFERQIGLVADPGVDRHHVIAPIDLHPMTGIIEDRGAGTGQRIRESGNLLFKTRLVEIREQRHFEAQTTQDLRDAGRVIDRIFQRIDGRVVRIPDRKRDSPFGQGRTGRENCK